jgi:TetR/AcrR family transcriptional regulator, transcriptional repressor for nem operon
MGRPRSFNEEAVLDAAAEAFVKGGYEGTSIDDLVKALNLHRGSLYKAFGSKHGLFLAVLRRYVDTHLANMTQAALSPRRTVDGAGDLSDLDLLLIAALERGHRDAEVAAFVRQGLAMIENSSDEPANPRRSTDPEPRPGRALDLLGARLFERLHKGPEGPNTNQLTTQET